MEHLLELLHSNSAQPAAEQLVLRLLYQIIAILCATQVVVWFSRRFLGQTDVSGEILAGLVLGPSCLGALFPGQMRALFAPGTADVFTAFAQMGLIFLMFEVGLEFQFGETFDRNKKQVLAVAGIGITVPFTLGFFTAPWFYHQLPGPLPPLLGFQLFFATAMSITAIPILGRIFMELGLSHTRIAALVLGAAAMDDVAGWIILGVVAAIVQSKFSSVALLLRIGVLAAYLGVLFFVVRPVVKGWIARTREKHGGLNGTAIALVACLLFVSATITSNIGVFAIIGGFCMGVALHDDRLFVEEWRSRITSMVRAVLLPVFFTYTGLRTDIGTLNGAGMWFMCLMVLAIAFVGKFGGTYIAARLVGESHRNAFTIGTCMNTRALMELVALNVGYDLGVVPRPMFTMLVIMAIASTFITTPLVRRLMGHQARPRIRAQSPALEDAIPG